MNNIAGAPMTVQQVYAEMIGVEDLTLERLQVYTYLKRLGYAVTRTNPPTPYYPTPPPWPTLTSRHKKPSTSVFQVFSLFTSWLSRISRLFAKPFEWWHPLRLHHHKNYSSLFSSLRFMPSGHKTPLYHPEPEKRLEAKKSSPYQIFYNLYKPSTPFKRSSLSPPDFQIVVINSRTTPMPTLQELTDLFDVLPELPPPLPRQRHAPISQANLPSSTTPTGSLASTAPVTPRTLIPQGMSNTRKPLFQRLLAWAFPHKEPAAPARRPHPFMALKAGKKIIVIAVVDSGNITFFRFGQGEFSEWPMA